MQEEVTRAYDEAAAAPDNPEVIGVLGMYYYASNSHLAAIPCFERAARLQPQSLRWWYYLGLSHIATYNVEDAVKALERAIEIDGSYAPILVELGDVLRKSDVSRARAFYEKVIKLSPADARAYMGMGECAMLEGDTSAARANFLKAIELAPKYADAHGAMVRLLTREGRPEEVGVHAELHKLGGRPPLLKDPLYVDLVSLAAGGEELLVLAERLSRAGQIDHAIVLLQRAIDKNASELAVRHALGVLLGIRGRFVDAVEEFRSVLKENPYQFKTMVDLSRALMRIGNYAEAEALLREVLSTGSGDPRALVLYGNLLLQLGRPEDAVRYLDSLVQLKPDFAEGRLAYASGLICQGKLDVAVAEYRKGKEQSTDTNTVGRGFIWGLLRLMADQRRAAESGAGVKRFLNPDVLTKWSPFLDAAGLTEESEAVRDYQAILAKQAVIFARKGAILEAERVARVALLESGVSRPAIIGLIEDEVSKTPEDPVLRHLLASLLVSLDETSAAYAQWRQLVTVNPTYEPGYAAWSSRLMAAGDHAEAQQVLREGMKHRPESPLLRNALAWTLATAPAEKDRDPEEAVRLARQACDAVEFKDGELLDTLAAAQASAGRFEEAVQTEQEAIKLAASLGQGQALLQFRKRLALYEKGEPYRESN